MSRVRNTHGRDDKCIENLVKKKITGTDHLRELGAEGRIILKCILKEQGARI
jgi:hypothetical protein